MRDVLPSAALRVLVVDDCPDTRAALAVLLGLWGHEVRLAGDGAAALTTADAFRPDVVLLDVALPGMDGYQVARRLREPDGGKESYVVSLSGYSPEVVGERALAAGCDLHWTKPVEPDALQRLLEERKASGRQDTGSSAAERATVRLHRQPYLALHKLTIECRDGVLTVRGCLPSYYLKQVALAAVTQTEEGQRVHDEIVVLPSSPRGI
jgi:CheY-like chemotaxis protein